MLKRRHLSGTGIAARLYLPTRQLERAALKRWHIWHFSTQGLPKILVAKNSRGLLHRVFTLIPPKAGRLFSVALSVASPERNTHPLGGALP